MFGLWESKIWTPLAPRPSALVAKAHWLPPWECWVLVENFFTLCAKREQGAEQDGMEPSSFPETSQNWESESHCPCLLLLGLDCLFLGSVCVCVCDFWGVVGSSFWLCGSQQTLENSSRDENTRPSYLSPEHWCFWIVVVVCESRSKS